MWIGRLAMEERQPQIRIKFLLFRKLHTLLIAEDVYIYDITSPIMTNLGQP